MRRILFVLCFVFLIGSLWYSLTIGEIAGPPGNPDSMVRNILYAHVPSSLFALLCFVVLLVASIGYLVTGKVKWDNLAEACGEVGALFQTGDVGNTAIISF